MIIVKYERDGKVYDWLQCSDKESLERWLKAIGPGIKIISIVVN